jgi:hypothetical protein
VCAAASENCITEEFETDNGASLLLVVWNVRL